nr:MAG TPA: hypothetical protein [Bacteriophage sp.]DAN23020.1 MAG TPA_asm: hypothetical protein [Bacteriophage sp.]
MPAGSLPAAVLWVEFTQKLKIGGCQDERKEP